MREARWSTVAAFALLAMLSGPPGRAEAQAVGFAPGVGTLPDGVSLNVTPVVSADRRYVRLSMQPNFQTINGFMNFPVPAAVGGGGNRGGGGLGGGAGGIGGGAGGQAGGLGGFANVAPGDRSLLEDDYYMIRRPTADSAKAARARATRGKKPLPDPVIVPIKKNEAKKTGPGPGVDSLFVPVLSPAKLAPSRSREEEVVADNRPLEGRWAPVEWPDAPDSELMYWQAYKLWGAITKRIAYEGEYLPELRFDDETEHELFEVSRRFSGVHHLSQNAIHIQDDYGSDFCLTIIPDGRGFSLSARQAVYTVRKGVIDEPGDMLHATHHCIDDSTGRKITQYIEGRSFEESFKIGILMVNELIDRLDVLSRARVGYRGTLRHLHYVDAGTLSYTSGLIGSALFMALSIGPGWLGFFISYVPVSILTTLAVAAHE